MNKTTYRNVMFALTLLFGAVIAVMAIVGLHSIGIVAAVGGVLLGLGWAMLGTLTRKGPSA